MDPPAPTLIVLEGRHDISFLKSISLVLRTVQPEMPDLASLELRGEIAFLTAGGVCTPDQAQQLVRLGYPQFHLWDRDIAPETSCRRRTVTAINALPRCVARITRKRSVENYLHPLAITEAIGIQVTFGDEDDVATLVAGAMLQVREPGADWSDLPHRSKKRRRNRAKKWLNQTAASRMTLDLLHDRDPDGEVIGWLTAVAELGRRGP